MDHVNNAVYVDWLEEALLRAEPDAAETILTASPRRYRLEYAAAASAGSEVSDQTWREGPRWHYRLAGRNGITPNGAGTEMLRATIEAAGGNP